MTIKKEQKRMYEELKRPQPPTCLHILGQGLTDKLHKEGRALYLTAVRICDAQICGNTNELTLAIEHMKLLLSTKDPTGLPGYRLTKLVEQYGHDFTKKLPLYKTAKLMDRWVQIMEVNQTTGDIIVSSAITGDVHCKVWELTDYCL